MLRSCNRLFLSKVNVVVRVQKQNFLTVDYGCNEVWQSNRFTPDLTKINLNDFYNTLDINFNSKGVISATDVDVFANALDDQSYLDELRDLLHKLRLSADTCNTLDSTHHATVRNYIHFNKIDELIQMLNEPLLFGIFLDDYSANILLDHLLTKNDYEHANIVASLVMKQESYNHSITCALCHLASYKFIKHYVPPKVQEEDKPGKVEEIKIRVRYLRNPYFDDHFDIKDKIHLAGKTLSWMTEHLNDNTSNNLKPIGWLFYEKFDKLIETCNNLKSTKSFKVYADVLELFEKRLANEVNAENKSAIESCISLLSNLPKVEGSLEKGLETSVENAINKCQHKDVSDQNILYKQWAEVRTNRLHEQAQRIDRANRIQSIKEKQDEMKIEEQKLWFFENEELIDMELEEKDKKVTRIEKAKAKNSKIIDEEYIPPEILPKKK